MRVALAHRTGKGPTLLDAVAARDHDGDTASALRAAVGELKTSERRCILALNPADAILRELEFPPMSCAERQRAATFEASGFIDFPIAEASVSLRRKRAHAPWLVGIARTSAVAATIDVARRSGLRPLAVDDTALALRRAYPEVDGVVDVGDAITLVACFGASLPSVTRLPIGGAHFTHSIARALGIDGTSAEARKRVHGFAGAAIGVRDEWIAGVTEAIAAARLRIQRDIRSLVLCGNGSRVGELPAALALAAGCDVAPATLRPASAPALPADVLRAAAPDWSLAYGLVLWQRDA